MGISTDDVETLKRFREELKLPFALLSDEEGNVSNAYAGTTLGFSSRTTVVVDEEGVIRSVTTGKDAIDPSGDIASCPLRKRR